MTLAIEARRRDSSDTMLILAAIYHPDLVGSVDFPDGFVRLVRYDEDVTSNAKLFHAYPLDFIGEARTEEGATSGATITFDNIDPAIIGVLRASRVAPTVTITTVMLSALNDVEIVLPDMALGSVTYDAMQIRGIIPRPDLLTEPAPYQKFGPTNCPGYF